MTLNALKRGTHPELLGRASRLAAFPVVTDGCLGRRQLLLLTMRGVTSLLRTAAKLHSGATAAQGHAWASQINSLELVRAAQGSSLAALRSHACAWEGMQTLVSASAFALQSPYKQGNAGESVNNAHCKTLLCKLLDLLGACRSSKASRQTAILC